MQHYQAVITVCGETVLSVAGQMLIPRRCKMSDIVFEQTVFLRYKLKEQE